MDELRSTLGDIGIDLGSVAAYFILVGIILLVAYFASRWLRGRVERTLSARSFGRNGAVLLGRLTALSVYLVAVIALLASLGVSWTGLLTFLGAGTVALSLALQDVLKNFFSGIFLLMERPFRVGDFIKVAGVEGEVQGIDVRTTLVKVSDGSVVMVPNSLVFTEVLTNRSKSGTRRIDLTIVATSRSIVDTERSIHDALRDIPEVSKPIAAPVVKSASSMETTLDLSLLIEDSRDVEQRVIHALVTSVDDDSIAVTRL